MIPIRPDFANPAAYLAHVAEAIADGREPWEPKTKAELVAALATYPHLAYRWRPVPNVMRSMGLPPDYGRDPVPITERVRERVAASVFKDPKWWRRLAHAIQTHEAEGWS